MKLVRDVGSFCENGHLKDHYYLSKAVTSHILE